MNVAEELQALAETWRTEIPITDAMALVPLSWEDGVLTVAAELAPNVNVHGTAFAGSLYAVAALSGWGSVHLALRAAGIPASIVIAEASIRYRRPVQQRIVARCALGGEVLDAALADLATARGKARIPLQARIEVDGELAAQLDGVYAVRRVDAA